MLKPKEQLLMPDGIIRGGFKPLLEAAQFLRKQQRDTLCLFNTPTLLGAFIPRNGKRTKRVAILDWTANCPRVADKPHRRLYDTVYRIAFSRMDAVASPSKEFRDFYTSKRTTIRPILYPLPYPEYRPEPRALEGGIKVLFIGADLERKGGHLLLDGWETNQPEGMSLTFVTPKSPDRCIEGVSFRNDIEAGTPEHRQLFETHDLLILPSYSEPFGYVLLEAINFGLVPLTPQTTGAADIVKDAGGLLSATPESCIEDLFTLVSRRPEIETRKRQVCHYNAEHNETCLRQLRQLFDS